MFTGQVLIFVTNLCFVDLMSGTKKCFFFLEIKIIN